MNDEMKRDVRLAVNRTWLRAIAQMKAQGMSEKQVAEFLDISVSKLRAATAIVKEEILRANKENVNEQLAKGYSQVAIARNLHLPLATVRQALADE